MNILGNKEHSMLGMESLLVDSRLQRFGTSPFKVSYAIREYCHDRLAVGSRPRFLCECIEVHQYSKTKTSNKEETGFVQNGAQGKNNRCHH